MKGTAHFLCAHLAPGTRLGPSHTLNVLILTTAREGTMVVTQKQRLREGNKSLQSLTATQCQNQGTKPELGTVTMEKGNQCCSF